jgi:hypothetical protein
VADAASSSWDVSDDSWGVTDDEIADPEQFATKRRRTARAAKLPKDVLLLTPKDPSPLSIVTQLLLSWSVRSFSARTC